MSEKNVKYLLTAKSGNKTLSQFHATDAQASDLVWRMLSDASEGIRREDLKLEAMLLINKVDEEGSQCIKNTKTHRKMIIQRMEEQ